MTLIYRLICRVWGHDWFPPVERREFLAWRSVCLRPGCRARHVALPSGNCLGPPAHPIAEHYDAAGNEIEHPLCKGPQ